MDATRATEADRRSRGSAGPDGDELEQLAASRSNEVAPARFNPSAIRLQDLAVLGRSAGNRAVVGLIERGRAGAATGPATMQLAPDPTRRRPSIQRQSIEEDDPLGDEEGLGTEEEGLPAVADYVAGLQRGAVGELEETYGPERERIGRDLGFEEGQAPPGAGSGGRPTIKRGSQGPAVVDLQARLNELGADPALDVDGIFGRLTKAAVITFQSENGLDPDGIVGPLTWGALDVELPDIPPDVDPLEGLPVTVVGHGASEEAVTAARTAAAELFGNLSDASRAQLLTTSVALDVIPHDQALTDLPEYAHLRGTNTFDGRLWDTVRGIQTDIAGVHRFAIAEEDLISVPGQAASYGDGFLAAHEGGHALQASSLTAAQLATLVSLYTTRLAASGPITQATPASAATAMWLNPAWYSAANKEEYFGNSVAAYLGHPYTNGDADQLMYNQSWLSTNDPGMFTLLQTVYNP